MPENIKILNIACIVYARINSSAYEVICLRGREFFATGYDVLARERTEA